MASPRETTKCDILLGGTPAETLLGLGGNDDLGGNDTAKGDTGNDKLFGGAGNDILNGGTGSDTATLATSWLTATITQSGANLLIAGGTDQRVWHKRSLVTSRYAADLSALRRSWVDNSCIHR